MQDCLLHPPCHTYIKGHSMPLTDLKREKPFFYKEFNNFEADFICWIPCSCALVYNESKTWRLHLMKAARNAAFIKWRCITASTSLDPDFCDPFKERIAEITNYFTVCNCKVLTNIVYFSKFAFRLSRSGSWWTAQKARAENQTKHAKRDNQKPLSHTKYFKSLVPLCHSSFLLLATLFYSEHRRLGRHAVQATRRHSQQAQPCLQRVSLVFPDLALRPAFKAHIRCEPVAVGPLSYSQSTPSLPRRASAQYGIAFSQQRSAPCARGSRCHLACGAWNSRGALAAPWSAPSCLRPWACAAGPAARWRGGRAPVKIKKNIV